MTRSGSDECEATNDEHSLSADVRARFESLTSSVRVRCAVVNQANLRHARQAFGHNGEPTSDFYATLSLRVAEQIVRLGRARRGPLVGVLGEAPRCKLAAAVAVHMIPLGLPDAHLDALGESRVGLPEFRTPRIERGGESIRSDILHGTARLAHVF